MSTFLSGGERERETVGDSHLRKEKCYQLSQEQVPQMSRCWAISSTWPKEKYRKAKAGSQADEVKADCCLAPETFLALPGQGKRKDWVGRIIRGGCCDQCLNYRGSRGVPATLSFAMSLLAYVFRRLLEQGII